MSKKNYFIGVDFGGTSIRAGVVDRKGQVLGFEKRKTQAELGTDVVFERLAVAIERATDGAVRRWDLRPDDWHRIWPELVGMDGAPPVPEAEAREA